MELGSPNSSTCNTSACQLTGMARNRRAVAICTRRLPAAALRLADDSQRVIHDVERAGERGVGNDQRRLDADDISSLATDADQHARLPRQAADRGRFFGGGLLRRPVLDQLDADHQTETSYFTDQLVTLRHLAQAGHCVLALPRRFLR